MTEPDDKLAVLKKEYEKIKRARIDATNRNSYRANVLQTHENKLKAAIAMEEQQRKG